MDIMDGMGGCRWVCVALLLACNRSERPPAMAEAPRPVHDAAMADKRFFTWNDFSDGFEREVADAADVGRGLIAKGMKQNRLSKLDFTFVSDEPAKLERLREFLNGHYPYTVGRVEQAGARWELEWATGEIPLTVENLQYWVLDMAKRGYEHDARLMAYGTPFDPRDQRFPLLDASREPMWFDSAMEQYRRGNLSGALIAWSHAIAINPRNADAWYSRAIVKNELHVWKEALRDYDQAIALAPEFCDALLNRGALKDDHGDHVGAIADYDKIIGLAGDDRELLRLAWFNRGNAKLNLGDKQAACAAWKKALELGEVDAQRRIDEHCGASR